jgi:hypothetical protein
MVYGRGFDSRRLHHIPLATGMIHGNRESAVVSAAIAKILTRNSPSTDSTARIEVGS